MFDQDTKPEKVYTGVRASNTHETLKPRDIFEVSGDGRPTSEWQETSKTPPVPAADGKYVVDINTPFQQIEKFRWPAKKLELPEELPLTSRVENLEAEVLRLTERVDGLLDRIALYNTKSSHKL